MQIIARQLRQQARGRRGGARRPIETFVTWLHDLMSAMEPLDTLTCKEETRGRGDLQARLPCICAMYVYYVTFAHIPSSTSIKSSSEQSSFKITSACMILYSRKIVPTSSLLSTDCFTWEHRRHIGPSTCMHACIHTSSIYACMYACRCMHVRVYVICIYSYTYTYICLYIICVHA